jgi:hypothetical protein
MFQNITNQMAFSLSPFDESINQTQTSLNFDQINNNGNNDNNDNNDNNNNIILKEQNEEKMEQQNILNNDQINSFTILSGTLSEFDLNRYHNMFKNDISDSKEQ